MADDDKNGKLPFEDTFHPSSRGINVLDAIDDALRDPDKPKEPEFPDANADDPALNLPPDGDDQPQVRPKDPLNPNPDGRFQKRIDAMHATLQQRERELAELRERDRVNAERLARLEGQGERNTKETFDAEYKKTLMEIKLAKEKGDTDAEVELLEKLTDMRSALRVAEAVRRFGPQPQKAPDPATRRQDAPDPAQTAPQQPQMVPLASNWVRMNPWFRHAEYGPETQMAHAIDSLLHAEGVDKNSPYYYNRMTEELRKRFPDLQVRGFDMRRKMNSSSSVVAGVGDRPGPVGGGKGISSEQLAVAKELGIANDPVAMKAYKEMVKRQENA